jgi:hypothetical protein
MGVTHRWVIRRSKCLELAVAAELLCHHAPAIRCSCANCTAVEQQTTVSGLISSRFHDCRHLKQPRASRQGLATDAKQVKGPSSFPQGNKLEGRDSICYPFCKSRRPHDVSCHGRLWSQAPSRTAVVFCRMPGLETSSSCSRPKHRGTRSMHSVNAYPWWQIGSTGVASCERR